MNTKVRYGYNLAVEMQEIRKTHITQLKYMRPSGTDKCYGACVTH